MTDDELVERFFPCAGTGCRTGAHDEYCPASQRSKPFADLANQMAETLPRGPETSAGLRKLLEAKDCFVRAALS